MEIPIRIRKSTLEDLPYILRIFDSAREYMRFHRNYSQWNDSYPSEKDIFKDILEDHSYVGIDSEGEIIMTFAFIKGEDPTYKNIFDGDWLNKNPYGTIHRIASNGKIPGVLKAACEYCFSETGNLRIDTHKDNYPMLHALNNLGFIKCGIILCRDGSPRIAFQKIKNENGK